MFRSSLPYTLPDSLECRQGVAGVIFEPNEDTAVLLVWFQGQDFKVKGLDGGQEGR
jgi:hypothetical protein